MHITILNNAVYITIRLQLDGKAAQNVTQNSDSVSTTVKECPDRVQIKAVRLEKPSAKNLSRKIPPE